MFGFFTFKQNIMKKISFLVEITFDENIDPVKDELEIAEKIHEGLVLQANGGGLAPDESLTFTDTLQVSRNGLILIEGIVR